MLNQLKYIHDENTKLTEEAVLEFEKKRNVFLPIDYKKIVLEKDGDYLENHWNFNVETANGSVLGCELANIYSLQYVDEVWDGYLQMILEDDYMSQGFPGRECIQCIGSANGGDKLGMGFKSVYFGKIYLFEHDLGDNDFILVAHSFTEFLSMLIPVTYDDER